MGRRGQEEEAQWAVEKASERVEKGDAEGALRLLKHAQRLHPRTPGLPELVALAQVCHAASCSTDAPHWHHILMISEKGDQTVIKKRYRQLALLLHPDKNKHARAEEAFKLISEAYGHLADGKETSDFQEECERCSFQCQPSCWDSMRSSGESLEGQIKQTNFQSCYFPFSFHTAEWKVEHEKLRLFRERAQAKVDSLARVLRAQRSKWNEEFGQTKGKSRKSSHCNPDRNTHHSEVPNCRSRGAAEKGVVNSQLYSDKVHASSGKGLSKHTDQKLSFNTSEGRASCADMWAGEELGSRRAVLHSHYGGLKNIREEVGDSFHVSSGGTADANAGDEEQPEKSLSHDATCRGPSCQMNGRGGCTLGKTNKLEEEWMVIDDFLAGLDEVHGQPTGQAFKKTAKECALEGKRLPLLSKSRLPPQPCHVNKQT